MIKIVFGICIILTVISCKQTKRPALAPGYLHHENGLHVITSVINNLNNTISIIYGNDAARSFTKGIQSEHQAGEKYVMVTSSQKRMPQWYGTNMNGAIEYIEYVITDINNQGKLAFNYTKKQKNDRMPTLANDELSRITFITSQLAAVFP